MREIRLEYVHHGQTYLIAIVIHSCVIFVIFLISRLDCLQSAFSLKNPSSSYLIQQDCKPLRYYYNKGLRPDEKRRTTDSFVVNKPSVSPETKKPIGQLHSWSVVRLQEIKIGTRHNQLQTTANQAVISVIKLLRISYRRRLL